LYHLNNDPDIDNGTAPTFRTAQFESVKSEVEAMKRTLNSRVFIHVARFDAQKNQNLLIDAFNELNKRGVDFLLLVLGPRFDTSEAQPLVAKACDRIKFLGVKSNVADYLYCAEAFCLSSNFEGLPISLIEALSAGLILTCTPVGGIPDVIEDGVIGYLSEDVSLDAYVEAIERYLKDGLSPERNIDYFNANFTMSQCAKKYLAVYGE
jgi:glycosyltransferase involved in cell wall biosynthesis